MIGIQMPDLTDNSFKSFDVKIKNKQFKFILQWSEWCNCCFLDIVYNDEIIIEDFALVNSATINYNNSILPQLIFKHEDNLTIQPIRETFKNYILIYVE